MYLFWNNIHCLKYLKTSQFPSIYIYTNQARTFITCRMLIIFLPTIQARTFIKYRTLIIFNAKFRPGCLFGHPVYSLPKSMLYSSVFEQDGCTHFLFMLNRNMIQKGNRILVYYICSRGHKKSPESRLLYVEWNLVPLFEHLIN